MDPGPRRGPHRARPLQRPRRQSQPAIGMSMIDRQAMPYRDCIGVALFNREGQVFIARRVPDQGADQSEVAAPWQMPQGGIDEGEDPLPAAYRELYEETSVRTIRLLAEAPEWLFYD